MAIRAKFPPGTFKKVGKEMMIRVEEMIIRELSVVGEKCVNYAKLLPADVGYTDQTGALRGSTGYVIFQNGQSVKRFFDGNQQGQTEGFRVAQQQAQQYNTGIVLVVVAGMNYATYLESRGRDVLTGATRLAENLIPKMMRQLTSNVLAATADAE